MRWAKARRHMCTFADPSVLAPMMAKRSCGSMCCLAARIPLSRFRLFDLVITIGRVLCSRRSLRMRTTTHRVEHLDPRHASVGGLGGCLQACSSKRVVGVRHATLVCIPASMWFWSTVFPCLAQLPALCTRSVAEESPKGLSLLSASPSRDVADDRCGSAFDGLAADGLFDCYLCCLSPCHVTLWAAGSITVARLGVVAHGVHPIAA